MAMKPTHDGADAGADQDGGGFDPLADILPDEIVDKHFAGEPREPAASHDLDGTDADDDDNLDDDEDHDDDEEDAEGYEDEGDDELDDGLQDEEDDEEEDEEEEEDGEDGVLESVSASELKAIDADPTLRKIHRHMQRDYTRKTMAVSAREKVAEQKEQRIQQFESVVQTPRGMVQFLTKNLEKHPDIIGAAFEAVATGENADSFLLEVALAKPEVFEKAYARFQELQDDDDARERHVERRDTAAEKNRVAREREQLRQERFDRESGALLGEALRAAKKFGVDKEDIPEVREAVARKLAEAVDRRTGGVALSKADVAKVVRAVKKDIDAQLETAKRRLARRKTTEAQKDVRSKAKRAQGPRRVVPQGRAAGKTGGATKRQASRTKVPSGVDPLDHYVNKRLGL
jgi:hypothetical protein